MSASIWTSIPLVTIQCPWLLVWLSPPIFLTRGRPSPALAQLTKDNCSLSMSAIGLARLEGGNTGPWQLGHWYPAGAVCRGNRAARWWRQAQWNTSWIERKGNDPGGFVQIPQSNNIKQQQYGEFLSKKNTTITNSIRAQRITNPICWQSYHSRPIWQYPGRSVGYYTVDS